VPGNGFQRRSFLSFRVQRLLSSLAGVCLTFQLGVAWPQSSKKGYNSRLYGSQRALFNRCLKTPYSRDYISRITITHSLMFQVTAFNALLGNVFQRWTFLCAGAHTLAGWRLPTPRWLASISQLTRRCYTKAYNNEDFSASHASARGDYLSLGISRTAGFRARLPLDSRLT
jgi:hypothetical protein